MYNNYFSTENLFINRLDESYNLDKFENGSTNVLFITGFSGSGKTTLGEELSYKYKCALVELDDIMTPNLYSDRELGAVPIVLKFFKENYFAKTHRHESKCYKLAEEFINFVMDVPSNERLIIEGVQIWLSINSKDNIIEYNKIVKFPIIFKGTAGLLSTFRALRRDKYKRTVYKIAHKYTYIFSDNMKIEKLRKLTKMASYNCDNLSNEGAVYASSLGMFGDSEENEEPYEISSMNFSDLKKEISMEGVKLDNEHEYIFIRNVRSVYKNKLEPSAILDKGIKLVDKEAKDSKFYNHSTLNVSLKDGFIGLTADKVNKKTSVKQEFITRPEATVYTNTCDPKKSQYGVFAIPVTKQQKQEISKMLNNSLHNPNIDYSTMTNFLIGAKLILNKLGLKSSESHHFDDTKLVCSSFVAYILLKCCPDLAEEFKKHNIDYSKLTPNSITRAIPNCRKLFGGYWINYEKDVQTYLKRHPELNKYYK